MKQKIQNKLKTIAQHPKTQETLRSMKPQKTIWGFLGVIAFFILPEIITYFYGQDITKYAQAQLLHVNDWSTQNLYKALIMSFGDGVSYLNLFIGFALLIWLFF